MAGIAPSIERLVDEFAKLPSVGRKTAQRLAFHLLKRPDEEAEGLAAAVLDAKRKVRNCTICYNYCESEICAICSDVRRDKTRICVVEQPSDIYPFEKMGAYNGLYHVLGGALSPLDGIMQEDIRIKELTGRISDEIKEIIIATNSNRAGEDTSLYLTKLMESRTVKVTRIARGIPMGSELEFTDEVTLYRAFTDRTES